MPKRKLRQGAAVVRGRYHPATIDDAFNIAFDPRDPVIVWEHYLETCRRSGVQPVSRERAQDLIAEWTATIVAALSVPTTH